MDFQIIDNVKIRRVLSEKINPLDITNIKVNGLIQKRWIRMIR